MKLFFLLIVALATTVTFCSCQKEKLTYTKVNNKGELQLNCGNAVR